MTEAEVLAFVGAKPTIIVCSNGPRDFPHPVAMWFVLDEEGAIRMTTYSKSQKVQNLRRNPNVTLLAESGVLYEELRGVIFYGRAEITEDTQRVLETLMAVSTRHRPPGEGQAAAMKEALRAQAAKRVEIRVKPDRVVSWDHTKLGGVY
jgi:nitroimidazol reductase NimA-like FMN-containing flavoprotein (pyridoxamine 5'-phosphate oxidase superfamily)